MAMCDCNQGRMACTCKPIPPAVAEYAVQALDQIERRYTAKHLRCLEADSGYQAGDVIVLPEGPLEAFRLINFHTGATMPVDWTRWRMVEKEYTTLRAPVNAALQAELDACVATLPGTIYMDPPDGGDVSVAEQLRRMGEDAARWRAVMQYGEGSAFEWFTAKYVQRADERQAALGLQYTEADYGFQPIDMPPAPEVKS